MKRISGFFSFGHQKDAQRKAHPIEVTSKIMDYVANSIKSALKKARQTFTENPGGARLAGKQKAEMAFQFFSQLIGLVAYRQSLQSRDEIDWRNVRNEALRGDFVGGFD